ncbi:YgiT-type zinc finger protein [Thermoflexus sp.]|uniref:YgiT-type zinc finger protein n=1 Tax=Thermoflexus sp. TaxID=1969742 RepID=UPI0025CE554C|nr:YgiT-type zinc finger protein [Thermoflexus sp.]MDW8180383.1 YgiT-type zinc finger protein [Anaerolineae bacterium]MCS6963139.1 YgiT-type zinc finger protein [Thermoflexus sp.]MCS7350932.1 YgiT-type zinc finger protein [Thermoflexus sp.]MCX7691412.1 YgiT-type zinc finger protein [Thermoflexus sp.]MDW8184622.1 YgiT-type zinc finger protein [Anaerolineae bacterium]
MGPCPNCRIGYMRPHRITYAGYHGDLFIVVPNMPAYICDVCGNRQYDEEALMQLIPLIGPRGESGRARDPGSEPMDRPPGPEWGTRRRPA